MFFIIPATMVLARIIEALRDAIDFVKAELPMGKLWHRLKYPQYALWGLFGYCVKVFHSHCDSWIVVGYSIAVGLAAAYLAFEGFLHLFKKINWRDKPWA